MIHSHNTTLILKSLKHLLAKDYAEWSNIQWECPHYMINCHAIATEISRFINNVYIMLHQ